MLGLIPIGDRNASDTAAVAPSTATDTATVAPVDAEPSDHESESETATEHSEHENSGGCN